MEQEDNRQFSLPMPVLSRLDRLDRLLHYLEEKQFSLVPIEGGPDKQCKPLSSALDEVQFKGTLMERLAMLENRVLQLSIELEEESMSGSSSSTIPAPQNIRHDLPAKQDGKILGSPEKQGQVMIQEEAVQEAWKNPTQTDKTRRHKRTLSIIRYRKWLGWFQMGC